MDTDCGGFMGEKTMGALLDDPQIASLAEIALKNLFRVQLRLGFADPPELVPFGTADSSVVDTAAHRALAKEAADQSLVLLKNDQKTLPFTAPASPKDMVVGVIGRNANAKGNMQGNYYGTAPFLVSPNEGIKAYASTYDSDGSDVDAALKIVKQVDAVVLVVGLTSEGSRPADEAEGHDRTSLLMPLNQDQLVTKVAAAAAAAGKPVTVVVMSGGPVDVSAAKSDPNVGAILWCGYPGQSGGTAIADAIFGKTNPSAKLTMTWYPESLSKEVAITDMGMRPNTTSGNPGRSHRFYTGTPVFAFGEGLSYTSFDTRIVRAPSAISSSAFGSDLRLSPLSSKTAATFTVEVTNKGERDGTEVILLFASPPNAGHDGMPLQSLISFDRVAVRPGQKRQVELSVQASHFTAASRDGSRVVPTGEWKIWVGPRGADAVVSVQLE
uniref:Fibronectin type III-like domain-containing protein n=1 Tax=Haptolina ericina TaxID=156174 RepID=A0A7S3APJ0_9EUKA